MVKRYHYPVIRPMSVHLSNHLMMTLEVDTGVDRVVTSEALYVSLIQVTEEQRER